MEKYYVILTGSKNNAGDYLIKNRALRLFKELRPDRQIIDLDGWKKFTPENLETINNASALILMGGPALQPNMRPNIYPMCPDIDDIKVPILTMGIGWKSKNGDWKDTNSYPLNIETKKLLDRINESSYLSSVRDYHTLNLLLNRGYDNFLMTGCPAFYHSDYILKKFTPPTKIANVCFSPGVSWIESASMENSMKEIVLCLSELFRNEKFEVAFHHTLNKAFYTEKKDYTEFLKKHLEFAEWLSRKNISYTDISGSAENLINYYSECDLHIGYRVHAHIFMCSISRCSVLLNEDGRGKAFSKVLSGLNFDSYKIIDESLRLKVTQKLWLKVANKIYRKLAGEENKRAMVSPACLTENLIKNIRYELSNDFPRLSFPRKSIDAHYPFMKKFIEQLP